MTRTELVKLLTDLPVNESAPYLLGSTLITSQARAQIVEVEAYAGANDPGSHAYRGPTPRTQVMFGPAGFVYTYFTYGNHWMLCITAEPDGPAAAVLVRAAIPQTGLEEMRINRPKAKSDFDLLNGPGKLCAALSINQSHYGLNALDHKSTLQIESAVEPHPFVTSTRIGLAPGKGDEFRWRFVSANNIDWASHPKSSLRRLDPQLPGYR